MNAKMKACFTPHIYMHSLIGFGLGLVLASFFSSLASLWLGLVLIVVGVVWDAMRKN